MSELPADPATSAAESMSDDTDQGGIISQPPGVPSHNLFPNLDGYRAIAAMMVVVTHVAFQTKYIYAGPVGAVLSRFDFGVTLFFLISGFLLYRPWARAGLARGSRPAVKPYLTRRFARIFPAYLLVLVAVLLILPSTRAVASEAGQWKAWLTHLTFTQAYFHEGFITGLTQMWSLGTEVMFYLALPVIGWLAARKKTGADSYRRQFRLLMLLILIGIAGTAIRAFLSFDTPPLMGFWLPAYIDWFALGMLFALLWEARSAGIPSRIEPWLQKAAADPWVPVVAGALVLLLAATPLTGPYDLSPSTTLQTFARHFLYAVAAALFLIPAVAGNQGQGSWRVFLQTPGMRFLGEISYGIFLWHLFVMETLYWALGLKEFTGQFWLILPPVVIGTIVMGWLSWVVVERPSIAWSHRVTRNPKPPAPQPPPGSGRPSPTSVGSR